MSGSTPGIRGFRGTRRRRPVMQRRLMSLSGNLILVCASVSLCLLLGEVGIRLVHPSVSLFRYPNFIAAATQPDPRGGSETLRYDSRLGYEPIPGSSGQLHD